jgi:hypothetical protein
MNVVFFSSGISVPGCHVNDDSVGNEADKGNEGCLPQFGMRVPSCQDNDYSFGNEADSGNECCLL